MNMLLRAASLEDVARLTQLALAPEFNRWTGVTPTVVDLQDAFARKIEASTAGRGRVIVAEETGELLGYASMNIGTVRAHVEYGVAGRHQGRGLAKRLLGELLSQPLATSVAAWVAICHKDNIPSLAVLQAHGFVLVGPWPKDPDRCLEFTRQP